MIWDGIDVGDCVVQRVDGVARVVRADRVVEVTRELLTDIADNPDEWPDVAMDGPFLGLCGTHAYRAMDRLGPGGHPLYALVST